MVKFKEQYGDDAFKHAPKTKKKTKAVKDKKKDVEGQHALDKMHSAPFNRPGTRIHCHSTSELYWV